MHSIASGSKQMQVKNGAFLQDFSYAYVKK